MRNNRWLLVGWAMLAVVACGSNKPKPRVSEHAFVVAAGFNPVKECETTTFGRYVRGATCPGAELLFISRALAPEALLNDMRSELTAVGHEPDTRSLLVNGKELVAISMTYGPVEKPVVSSLNTALGMNEGADSIEIQCYAIQRAIDPKRCKSLLESFIQQGLLNGEWPSVLGQTAARRPITYNVAGHEVLLPSNCEKFGLFEVDCPDGHIEQHMLNQPDRLQSALSGQLARRASPSLLLEREIECAVEGLPALCIVRKFRLPFGDELHAYHAALEIRGLPIVLACETKRSRSSLLPGDLCSRFFSFEPGVLDEPPVE